MATNWRIRQAVTVLNKGGVIAYPTEAVYGLGCDPWNEDAIMRLLVIKQRPWYKGLIIIAADFNQLQPFIEPVSPAVLSRLESSWPGPTTWLLPVRPDVPEILYGEHNTIAVRVTAHKQAAELCRAADSALVSTSANVMGLHPAHTIHHVRWKIPDIDYVLPGQCSGSENPTTIRNAQTGEKIR